MALAAVRGPLLPSTSQVTFKLLLLVDIFVIRQIIPNLNSRQNLEREEMKRRR